VYNFRIYVSTGTALANVRPESYRNGAFKPNLFGKKNIPLTLGVVLKYDTSME